MGQVNTGTNSKQGQNKQQKETKNTNHVYYEEK
jgi:hypothetical protein